ncbi:MAG: hypothetical protein IJ356_07035 [Erysipelotrichaceae bacterium]|nr:hypothetical protein [Erysipelotrichaceae bacterium]
MKKILSLIKFLLLMGMMLCFVIYLSAVFRPRKTDFPNDTTRKVSGFYALEEYSMDILFMGTSHTYYGFNPSVIYEKTGLNSYVFAGECQPISVTYHYLVEALKTQKPKLIVLDVFALLPSANKCQTDGIIKVNVENLKFSRNKIDALKLIKNENLWENLLDVSIYKERWNEITEEDFKYPVENHFNEDFGYTTGYPVDSPLYVREKIVSDEIAMPEREDLKYLFQIFNMAKEHEIELLLVKTPYYETLEEHHITNYLFQEAEEYGFHTLDFNQYYDELNYVFDRDGDVWHCNVRGAWKVSNMLADYVFEHFQISIQKSIYEDAYHAQYIKTIQNLFWSEIEAEHYLEYLQQMNMTFLVNYKGKNECNLTNKQWELLKKIGIHPFDPQQDYLAIVNNGEIIYELNQKKDFTEWVTVDDVPLTVSSYDSFVSYDTGEEIFEFNHYGLNILVVDLKTKQLLDKISLDTVWGFEILR